MLFSSIEFIFLFLPVFLIIYYLLPAKGRNAFLFLGSLFFYGVGEPKFVLLMLVTILVNYCIGLLMDKAITSSHNTSKTFLLILALAYNFGVLFFFKYTNFFIENVNLVIGHSQNMTQLSLIDVALPLGISFYTFQIVSYIFDIYKGTINAEKNFIDLGAYISMFPQLIAGPIVIYNNVKDDLKSRQIGLLNIEDGLKYFVIGLIYKVVLANQIGTLWNNVCTVGFESITTALAWLGALSYSFQLYFDFCGYSLMALGLGKMLGFSFPKNFDHPYEARSITQFWRKWHITLGSWFREYVYIPLGGSRKGKIYTIRNLFIVWLLVGFWHGASWNFIIWGLLIFLLEGIEKVFLLKYLEKNNIVSQIISRIYVWSYILISWTVFAITDLKELSIYLCRMFPFFGVGNAINARDFIPYLSDYTPLLICCLLFSTSLPSKFYSYIKDNLVGKVLYYSACLGFFWYAVYFLCLGASNPFLYFRF